VPGPVTSAASAGCHRLLREYDAQCVTTPAEVNQLLGMHASPDGNRHDDPEVARLLDAVSRRRARSMSEIAHSAGLSENRAGAILGLLLLEGVVERGEAGWRRIGP
jgi:DNA processing protein